MSLIFDKAAYNEYGAEDGPSPEASADRERERAPIDWTLKPAIQTAPFHHFCTVMERSDIEERLHSSRIDVYDAGIKLDGRRNKARLVQVIACGPGRWVAGNRQPSEVSPDALVYVKERTIPFRLHLQKQNHFFIAMDAVMAHLDPENVRLRPCGAFIMTREVDERARVAVMGSMPFHIGKTLDLEKKGSEADDVGCNTTRIEEVVAVGPGKFGGFRQRLRASTVGVSAFPAKINVVTAVELVDEPWWEAPDCKPGDLVAFTDMARPTTITIAGRSFTFFEFDHSICAVLDSKPVEYEQREPATLRELGVGMPTEPEPA